jgi:hypothetical protein
LPAAIRLKVSRRGTAPEHPERGLLSRVAIQTRLSVLDRQLIITRRMTSLRSCLSILGDTAFMAKMRIPRAEEGTA